MSIPFEKEEILSEYFQTASRVSELAQRGISKALKDAPQCNFEILHKIYCLMKANGGRDEVAVADLVRNTGLSPQAVSRILRGLEQDGLILRKADAEDHRRTLITLTGKGEQNYSICQKIIVDYLYEVVQEFGLDNLKKMNKLNELLREAFEIVATNQNL